MSVSVGSLMRAVHNFFETGYRATTYTVRGGVISPADVFTPGMYIAVTRDSVFYSGVWRMGDGGKLEGIPEGLPDETFFGRVYMLHPPADFLDLHGRIAEFEQKTPNGGYQSESFGEYSYTRASGKSGGVLGWQEAFADDLRPYRRMFTEVDA